VRSALLAALACTGCAQLFHIDDTSAAGGPDGGGPLALVSVTVTGVGTVTSTPAGIDCGTTCAAEFPIGSDVTLTAADSASFGGWAGACSGTGDCTVTVTGPLEISATFSCPTGSMTFGFTGAPQTFTAPACVTMIMVDLSGAAGGTAFYMNPGGTGGLGGRVQAMFPITSTDVLTVTVGGAGGAAANAAGGTAGFNGGAIGAAFAPQSGGGGGGASDIRLNGSALTDRVFVGGGGGGAAACAGVPFNGGAGGGLTGGQSTVCSTSVLATGGTQTAGGVGGSFSGYSPGGPGVSGDGGTAGPGTGGGGAGGGYFGGGGGAWTGGAGGSSYASPNATGVTMTQGSQVGDGTVTISY